MTDLHKTDTSAVVNILDEILEENLEDLGGAEDTKKTKTVLRRSQRTSAPSANANSSASPEKNISRQTRRASRRDSQSRTGETSEKNEPSLVEPKEDEEFDDKSISANTSACTNEELNNTASLPENAHVSEVDQKELDTANTLNIDDKMEPKDRRGDSYNEISGSRDTLNLNQEQNFDDTRSNVSSSDEDDDGTSQISNPSLSSASFKSDNEDGDRKEEPIKQQVDLDNVQPEKQDRKDFATRLNYILRDARFFLMKSNNIENIEISKMKNVWSTPPTNEGKINQSMKQARNVLLLFSVKESGKFSGFARLGSESHRGGEPIDWVLPPGLSQRALGGVFTLDWISKHDLPFTKTQHLFNRWNDSKPVKIGRDGQEVEPHVASELCKLFPVDASTNWSRVLRKSKDAAKTVEPTRVVAPIGMNMSSSLVPRGRGSFRDNRRDPRGRISSSHLTNSTRSFDYGRGIRRRFGEDEYEPRPKRSRGAAFDYGGNFPERRYEMSSSQRFSRNRNYSDNGKAQSSSHIYSDYVVRDYHHRPPPIAPLPYPPPPPFDSLPPLPRYYDGPPLPEFPTTSSSSRTQRSTSPYEKSVTDFLRRTGDRRERDRTRDRERDHERKYHRR